MRTSTAHLAAISADRPTAVYRFYDGTGRLLYVGITHNLGSRFGSHERKAAWWVEQQSVVVVWRETRSAAAAEERAAIRAEGPLHNISGARAARRERQRLRRRERLDEAMRQAIGLEVRVEIARSGRSKREVREHLDLSTQSLWQRMVGRTEFRKEELDALAEFLGIPVSRFFPASAVAA